MNRRYACECENPKPRCLFCHRTKGHQGNHFLCDAWWGEMHVNFVQPPTRLGALRIGAVKLGRHVNWVLTGRAVEVVLCFVAYVLALAHIVLSEYNGSAAGVSASAVLLMLFFGRAVREQTKYDYMS